jgi:peptidyl-prolyl cis-trans isomerase B (cyclophilin B)
MKQSPLTAMIVLFASLCPLVAHAQLTPDREYYGINRAMPMRVKLPEREQGALTITLFRAGSTDPEAVAPVEAGGVDLASLFPVLWTTRAPEVMYAQASLNDQRIGPPVVLIPMTTPATAMVYSPRLGQPWFTNPQTRKPNFEAREGEIAFVPGPPAYSGVRAFVDQHVVFDTSLGEIEFRMRPEHAPVTVCNFLALVKGGYYTDITFHRVVPRLPSGAPFVIQVGDPTGGGDGGPGFSLDLEPSRLEHDFGVLSMARDAEPNTNGAQVFVCLSREGTRTLDGKYTSFAEAVRGGETILSISATPVKGDRPIEPPVLHSARLVDAPPYGRSPPRVAPPSPGPRDR